MYCIIPQKYMDKIQSDDEKQITNKEINDAIDLLKQARSQKQKNTSKSEFQDMYIHKGLYKENFI